MYVTNGLLCLILAVLLTFGYQADHEGAGMMVILILLSLLAAVVFFLVALVQSGFIGWAFSLLAGAAQ